MNYINLRANAKINLALDVSGKRPDNYHDIKTVFQSLALCDTIYIRKIYIPEIKLASNVKWLPVDERNLAYKACKALFDIYNPDYGVYIEIYKRIPVSAGLGGGSADCAAVLLGLKQLFNLPVTIEELMEIGGRIGADVPFCIMKGAALAWGIGDKLTAIKPLPKLYVLLAKPNVSVSTARVFEAFNISESRTRPNFDRLVDAIARRDLKQMTENMINALETVTIKQYPIIEEIKKAMVKKGAAGVLMSGSGPTVFGLFQDKAAVYTAFREIKDCFRLREVFVTHTYNPR